MPSASFCLRLMLPRFTLDHLEGFLICHEPTQRTLPSFKYPPQLPSYPINFSRYHVQL